MTSQHLLNGFWQHGVSSGLLDYAQSPSEGRIGWGSCTFLNNLPSKALLDISAVRVYLDLRRAFDVDPSSG